MPHSRHFTVVKDFCPLSDFPANLRPAWVYVCSLFVFARQLYASDDAYAKMEGLEKRGRKSAHWLDFKHVKPRIKLPDTNPPCD